jgi:hypothetical protein
MKRAIMSAILATALAAWTAPAALADPDKDESGHGRKHYGRDYRDDDEKRAGRRGHRREYKEEFRYGDCKTERKWEKDGGYKEETKCEGGSRTPSAAYDDRYRRPYEPGPPPVYRDRQRSGWVDPIR